MSSSGHASTEMAQEPSSYGPVRRKVTGKSGPMTLYRPPSMAQDDFTEMMQEVVPQLLEQVLAQEPSDAHASTENSSSHGQKRDASSVDQPDEGQAKTRRTESPVRAEPASIDAVETSAGVTFSSDEVTILAVEHLQELSNEKLTMDERQELFHQLEHGSSVEVLVANYMQKKAAKEIRGTGNEPELQSKVDEAKLLEWNTILAKNAARIVLGPEAEYVRRKLSHRVMGSRYVITIKQEDDAPARVKARWCLQGHLDPRLA